jgi:hypothetical protein
MRLIPVQVERDTQEHHLDGDESHRHVAPERQLEETVREKSAHRGILVTFGYISLPARDYVNINATPGKSR